MGVSIDFVGTLCGLSEFGTHYRYRGTDYQIPRFTASVRDNRPILGWAAEPLYEPAEFGACCDYLQAPGGLRRRSHSESKPTEILSTRPWRA